MDGTIVGGHGWSDPARVECPLILRYEHLWSLHTKAFRDQLQCILFSSYSFC